MDDAQATILKNLIQDIRSTTSIVNNYSGIISTNGRTLADYQPLKGITAGTLVDDSYKSVLSATGTGGSISYLDMRQLSSAGGLTLGLKLFLDGVEVFEGRVSNSGAGIGLHAVGHMEGGLPTYDYVTFNKSFDVQVKQSVAQAADDIKIQILYKLS